MGSYTLVVAPMEVKFDAKNKSNGLAENNVSKMIYLGRVGRKTVTQSTNNKPNVDVFIMQAILTMYSVVVTYVVLLLALGAHIARRQSFIIIIITFIRPQK